MLILPPQIAPLQKASAKLLAEVSRHKEQALARATFAGTNKYRAHLDIALRNPTPFTKRGVYPIPPRKVKPSQRSGILMRVSLTAQQTLAAIVLLPRQMRYLRYQLEGGVRTPNPAKPTEKHGLPIGLGKRDRYGNVKGLAAKAKAFAFGEVGKRSKGIALVRLASGNILGFKSKGKRRDSQPILFAMVAVYRKRLRFDSVIRPAVSRALAGVKPNIKRAIPRPYVATAKA